MRKFNLTYQAYIYDANSKTAENTIIVTRVKNLANILRDAMAYSRPNNYILIERIGKKSNHICGTIITDAVGNIVYVTYWRASECKEMDVIKSTRYLKLKERDNNGKN